MMMMLELLLLQQMMIMTGNLEHNYGQHTTTTSECVRNGWGQTQLERNYGSRF